MVPRRRKAARSRAGGQSLPVESAVGALVKVGAGYDVAIERDGGIALVAQYGQAAVEPGLDGLAVALVGGLPSAVFGGVAVAARTALVDGFVGKRRWAMSSARAE